MAVDAGDWCWHVPRCSTLKACDQKRQEQFDADLEAGRKYLSRKIEDGEA